MHYTFDCGCQFKQFDTVVKDCDGLPPLEIDYYNLKECPEVWGLLGSGKTKGVFQLEQSLGRKWCKELFPENIHHLAALSAILRPGCLESMIDDKNITQHYCDNKNGKQDKIPIHPSLEKILEDTEQMLIYQEEVLLIAKEIAGFTGAQADILRRGIGHKDPKILFEMEKQFLDGCEKMGIINLEEAKTIFNIIKKSNRYLFNASHSYAYGTIGYWTAYVKHHFPLHFYAAYLSQAKDKQDTQREIKELINDANNFGVDIEPPHILSLNNSPEGDVSLVDRKILFGIIDIKGIGLKQVEKLYHSIQELEKQIGASIKQWSWEDFMINIKSSSTVVNNLILVGATSGGKPRKQKAFEYSIYCKLTDREKDWVQKNYQNQEDLAETLAYYSTIERKDGGPSNVKRKALMEDFSKSLKESPFSTKDHPDWVVNNEKELIGIPLTYSSTESKQVATSMTCADFLAGKRGKIKILVEISSFKEVIIKNGKNKGLPMAFLELKDSTGNVEATMFSEAYMDNQEYAFEENVVLIDGYRDKNDKSKLIINEMEQV